MSKCALRSTADFFFCFFFSGLRARTRTATLVKFVYAFAMSWLRKLRRNDPVGLCIRNSTSRSGRVARASDASASAAATTYRSAASTPAVPTTRTPMSSARARACASARSSEKSSMGASAGRAAGKLNLTLQRATRSSAARNPSSSAGCTKPSSFPSGLLDDRRLRPRDGGEPASAFGADAGDADVRRRNIARLTPDSTAETARVPL